MAKSSIFRNKGSAGEVSINLTPMIDCTFQLIIFFILATRFASAQLAKVELYEPYNSAALTDKKLMEGAPNRTIINIVSKEATDTDPATWDLMLAARADKYVVGGANVEVGDTPKLVKILKANRDKAKKLGYKQFFVEIRADNRVNYSNIEPVMLAASEAGIPKMNITAIVRD